MGERIFSRPGGLATLCCSPPPALDTDTKGNGKPNNTGAKHTHQIVFALQTLLHNLHMQQPEETAAEAEAHRATGLRLERQGGVRQLQL